jgi:Cytochrome P460
MRSGLSSIRDWTSETIAVLPMSKVAKTKVTTAAGIGLAGTLGMIAIAANGQTSVVVKEQTVADANGNLHVPDAYRTTYQSLGSWAVAAEQGQELKELHVVYASPGTIDAYRKDGRFPDGTVLVKEVFQTATGQMTTGTVSHAEGLKGWFVMMKDNKGSHPDNKLWGSGWGWSWFDADNPAKTTSTDYKANCLACHIPAQATDWVYVGGYPPLKQ